jgi:Holliday junction resolvasome RuvABC endonuclease subunit
VVLLALDASTTMLGWALLDLEKRHPDDLLEYGRYPLRGHLWDRLDYGQEWARRTIDPARVGLVAIETPVVYRNAKSTIRQAYMVGVLGLLAHTQGLEVVEIRPDERLTALGLPARLRDPKGQVTRNVNGIYSLSLGPKDHDIADAIAIGWAARRRLMLEGVSGD